VLKGEKEEKLETKGVGEPSGCRSSRLRFRIKRVVLEGKLDGCGRFGGGGSSAAD